MSSKIYKLIAVHPCEFLKDCLANYDDLPDAFYKSRGTTRAHIESYLDRTKRIDLETATLLENLFEVPSSFWVNAQNRYDKYKKHLSKERLSK